MKENENPGIVKGGKNEDYEEIKDPDKQHPHRKHLTKDGFVNWYEQKTFGTKTGSLGMSKQTVGRIMQFDDFSNQAKKLQGGE